MKAVILAGGSGTRLWPLSKKEKPKQFQPIVSSRSLFQEAIDRLDFLNPKDIYIALNKEHYFEVKKQAKDIPEKNLIIEPDLRDTASCIGLAAVYIGKKHKNEVMSIIYADHLVKNTNEFREKLKIAEYLAKKEHTINIIEVKANYPNPHLGYVKIGKLLKEIKGHEIYSLEKFIEKPEKKIAEKFLTSYKYLWNTGYFVWRIQDILKEYQKHLPKTYEKLIKIQKSIGTEKEETDIAKYYPQLEKISIDYGIMEKIDRNKVRIIPSDLGWSDIGNFEALFNELVKGKKDNLCKGKSLSLDTQSSVIYNFEDKLIATLGLKDFIIVNTSDSLLIYPKEKGGDLKKLLEKIGKKYQNLM
ncbi:mannose-1-phosphate guanylyltransferase [Candidatus Peregrinibacteria bacterium]|nr:mannose-1-phosphate guanylyltransferase [Candidatus Peregrinibacteria bacterium]